MPAEKARLLKTGSIAGVRLYELPLIRDPRGSLSFAEYGDALPFVPKRYFIVFDVAEGQTRGGHAHRTVHQFLMCVKGSCLVSLDDGKHRDEAHLDKPNLGLYVPPRIWASQRDFSRDAVLAVLASEPYDSDEYIMDYNEFQRLNEDAERSTIS